LIDRFRLLASAAVMLFYWGFWAATLLPLSMIVAKLIRGQAGREFGQEVIKKFFAGFVILLKLLDVLECEYVGFEKLRAHTGSAILAPNHPALWDAVLVIAELQRTACVMKASLLYNPLLYCGSMAAGYISSEPAHKMMRRCIELLKGHERIVFFPEGTRTRPENGRINPFSGGLVVIAKSAGAPVWPIFIETNSRYLGKGWPLWQLPRGKIYVKITVGTPIYYSAEQASQSFLDQLQQQYISAACGGPDEKSRLS